MWNGKFFVRKSLKDLGLVLQLGHPPNERCRCPIPARTGFVVVDIDLIQEVDIHFCACQSLAVVGEGFQQLLRRRLFPATVISPHTAFTFRVLTFFHALTLHGKVTMYDFYRAIEARTDAAGLGKAMDRYDPFVRVMRIWREVKKLRRGGVGNEAVIDLSKVPLGALALVCWACPNPKFNLPDGWWNRTEATRYAIDSGVFFPPAGS
jgi:hypothetical protein